MPYSVIIPGILFPFGTMHRIKWGSVAFKVVIRASNWCLLKVIYFQKISFFRIKKKNKKILCNSNAWHTDRIFLPMFWACHKKSKLVHFIFDDMKLLRYGQKRSSLTKKIEKQVYFDPFHNYRVSHSITSKSKWLWGVEGPKI